MRLKVGLWFGLVLNGRLYKIVKVSIDDGKNGKKEWQDGKNGKKERHLETSHVCLGPQEICIEPICCRLRPSLPDNETKFRRMREILKMIKPLMLLFVQSSEPQTDLFTSHAQVKGKVKVKGKRRVKVK